jgi:hypothetical protein
MTADVDPGSEEEPRRNWGTAAAYPGALGPRW